MEMALNLYLYVQAHGRMLIIKRKAAGVLPNVQNKSKRSHYAKPANSEGMNVAIAMVADRVYFNVLRTGTRNFRLGVEGEKRYAYPRTSA